MQILNEITEDEVVAHFLKTEITSDRFKKYLLDILVRDNKDIKIINEPNLDDTEENQYRSNMLGEVRGWRQNKFLFTGFPSNIKWLRVILNKNDIKRLKYLNLDEWVFLSGGTRLVKDAIENIKPGEELHDQIISASKAMDKGVKFPEMILVSKDENSDLVVLEGHLRSTAYMLSKNLPDQLGAILGISSDLGY